jgi:hypothetical protein
VADDVPDPERQEEQLTGEASLEVVRRGTGSEHEAVVLRLTGGERVILQRRGGNPFRDPHTMQLAGHTVRARGFRIGDIFRFVEAEAIDR